MFEIFRENVRIFSPAMGNCLRDEAIFPAVIEQNASTQLNDGYLRGENKIEQKATAPG
jgi:hypothetical protein